MWIKVESLGLEGDRQAGIKRSREKFTVRDLH